MNQVRSGRYYASEDFDHKKPLPRWVWGVIFFGIVASYIIAAIIGAIVWERETNPSGRAKVSMPYPVIRPQATPAAYTRWTCEKQEFREYLNACTSRERMGKVTQK